MIKFEEHDDRLFRMLEEPTPLTPDAEMPCLVRLIQDDSPMGKHNKDLHGFDPERLTPKICTEIIDVNDLSDPNRGIAYCDGFMSVQYYRYELIGTHVKEGSDKWALYHAINGEIVTMDDCGIYKIQDGKLWECFPNDSNEWRVVADDGYGYWLEYIHDNTGWQIYKEPKPEPIFTTGDKVTDGVIEGTIIHIEDAIADVCPSTDKYKIELRNLNHIPESPKQDDVEKPLRSMIAEAKAIGKNIRTYYQDIVFTPQALEACLNQGIFRWWNICNWELTTREQNFFPSISTSSDKPKEEPPKEPDYVICKRCGGNQSIPNPDVSNTAYTTCPKCGGTGYEIKEPCDAPNPESATQTPLPVSDTTQYKVGDWVEIESSHIKGKTFVSVIKEMPNQEHYTVRVNSSFGGYTVYGVMERQIIRKLKPSEVIVTIGCLSGTVVHSVSEDCFLLARVNDPQHRACCIDMSMLDTETRELVEGLLKQIEEEE